MSMVGVFENLNREKGAFWWGDGEEKKIFCY